MKRSFLTILCLLVIPFCTFGGDNGKFNIKGITPEKYNGYKAIISTYDYDGFMLYSDTVVIENAKFQFKGQENLNGPSEIKIFERYSTVNKATFFLEQGNINMEISANDTIPSIITGTPLNDIYKSYQDLDTYYGGEVDRNLPPVPEGEVRTGISIMIGTPLAQAYDNWTQFRLDFKRDNISNAVGKSILIKELGGFSEGFYLFLHNLSYDQMYNFADSTILNNSKYKRAKKEADIQHENALKKSAIVNEQYTDWELMTPTGEKKNLSDYVGKHDFVFIDFWASWCSPCINSIPALKRTYNTYKDHNIEFVGISLDDKKENWINMINKLELPWPQLSDLKAYNSELAKNYNVNGIPYGVLIDRAGKIVSVVRSDIELNLFLENLNKTN